MRSTWLSFGLGLFTLIGCNALWQGYLSPLDNPDGSVEVADLTGADLTGTPPDDLTGADLTSVPPPDMTMPTKLCGFGTVPSNVFKYAQYSTITTLPAGPNYDRIAAIDINNDGIAEVGVSDGTATVRVVNITKSAATCTYASTANCAVTNAVLDIEALQISPTVSVLVTAAQNGSAAISTCTSFPPTPKVHSSAQFSSSPTSGKRFLSMPRIENPTSGQFIFSEKSGDGTGDRVVSVKIDAAFTLSAVTLDTIGLNAASNGSFEPRYAAGARIDDVAPDGNLDFVTIEAKAGSERLAFYNNNGTAPQLPKGSTAVAVGFEGSNDIISAKLSNDSYDDIVTIANGSAQITPYIIANPTTITKMPVHTVPNGANSRNNLLFYDLDKTIGFDELLAINTGSSAISIYTYSAGAWSAAMNILVKSPFVPVAMALGYLDKATSPSTPDIFVLAKNGSTYEVGVIRWVPPGFSL